MTASHAPLTGVVSVINNLDIVARLVPTPEEVEKEVEDALVRDARLDARGIFVQVENSRVLLEGTVRNWTQAEDAEDAWAAPGVTQVDNQLEVVP